MVSIYLQNFRLDLKPVGAAGPKSEFPFEPPSVQSSPVPRDSQRPLPGGDAWGVKSVVSKKRERERKKYQQQIRSPGCALKKHFLGGAGARVLNPGYCLKDHFPGGRGGGWGGLKPGLGLNNHYPYKTKNKKLNGNDGRTKKLRSLKCGLKHHFPGGGG